MCSAMNNTTFDSISNRTVAQDIFLVNARMVVISIDRSTVKSMLHLNVQFIVLYGERVLICVINRKTNTSFGWPDSGCLLPLQIKNDQPKDKKCLNLGLFLFL